MNTEKLSKSTTTDGNPPALGYEHASAPQPIGADGQHGAYWILSEEERAKGFVRPLRKSYRHVGPPGPKYPLRNIGIDENEVYAGRDYVKYEKYLLDESPCVGRYWTQSQLDAVGKGCGAVTTMGLAICETYARDPRYYGSTFCCACGAHFPVNEFRWIEDDAVVGS